jgi:FkbM family methyltransferase
MPRMNFRAMKQRAFASLLGLRRMVQRSGVDRLARRNARFEAMLRSLYRGAYGKLQSGDWVTREISGLRFSAPASQRDTALLLQNGAEGESAQAALLESLLSPGQTFVDVGAHIGLYAVRAARRVGPAGRVFAFEPAPENFRALARNIAQNGFSNIQPEPLAVARRGGRASFTLSSADSASHTLAGSLLAGTRIEVGTVSLDEYFRDVPGRVDLIKLDAEGAELEILGGMREILAANPRLILFTELYPRAMEASGGSPQEFLDQLDALGFTLNSFDEGRLAAAPLRRRDFSGYLARLYQRGLGINVLCRREIRAARIPRPAARLFPEDNPRWRDPDSKPLISIAIPAFNRGALLEQTLAGIVPQLGEDADAVVLDTGSTDGTRERILGSAARNPCIRFFDTPERLSLDEALLELLPLCRGEYVWFFSSDDRMKPGAVNAARRQILESVERPALVYLNQEIVDESGRTLIAAQAGRRDRRFPDGRCILPFLGLNLGFISASLIPRARALAAPAPQDFCGTRSLNLHLYLTSLLAGGPAYFVAAPWIAARRAPGRPPYGYAEVFVHGVVGILDGARRRGFRGGMIFRAMQRMIAQTYLPLVVSWRADDPEELARTFPAMRRACWKYPAFWLLLAPARWMPRRIVRSLRDILRERRIRRNAVAQAATRPPENAPAAARAAGA